MTPGRFRFVLVACVATAACGGRQELSLCAGQDSSASVARLAPADEPGKPMVVSGRVLVGRNRAPVSGARLLVYHTNAAGKYARDGSGYPGAYLCGVLRTDEDGRYRLETVRPGHRSGNIGAHIHFDVSFPWGDRIFDSLSFENDPILGLPAGERWEEVRPVTVGEDGVQYVEKDLWVRY